MITLFWYFATVLARAWLGLTVLFILVFLVSINLIPNGYFISYVAIATTYSGLVLVFVFATRVGVGKNLSWIQVLPFSKRQILMLNYLVNIINLILYFLFCFALIVLALAVKDNDPVVSPQNSQHALGINMSWISAATLTFVLAVIHSLCLSFYSLSARKRFASNLWNHLNVRSRRVYSIGILITPFLLVYFKSFFLTGVIVDLLVLLVFVFLPSFAVASTLALSRTQKKSLVRKSLAFALSLFALVFCAAIFGSQPNHSVQERISSILFLGPFTQGIRQEDAAALLETEVGGTDLVNLMQYYRNKFHDGKKVMISQDVSLHFTKTIQTKKTLADVVQAYNLFDYSDLGYDELKTILTKFYEWREEFPPD